MNRNKQELFSLFNTQLIARRLHVTALPLNKCLSQWAKWKCCLKYYTVIEKEFYTANIINVTQQCNP